ncbi:unnamed protein product [Aureobasidium vineae]|uniref:Uncharacterized protein n=1 Tax=Aureobasidium vineae TaxID=2773715 RepID=A0A9N8K3A9_9PEZI|nr:unnamed protein product [Aureobasidium vineae]
MASQQLHIHLITLQKGSTAQDVLRTITDGLIIKGKPHGWVHQPHSLDRHRLLAHAWHLFFVTKESKLQNGALEHVRAHITIPFSLPKDQFEQLQSTSTSRPRASDKTPPLPQEWQGGDIPKSAITSAREGSLRPGELHLDPLMTEFLFNALPVELSNEPVSLFNLFKYKGSSAVHDDYMEDFKKGFGSSAGATVRFMAPVSGPSTSDGDDHPKQSWDDANFVQYDTIWHYAYMLSTDLYAPMNKKKVSGLDDTCILCVSEVELWLWEDQNKMSSEHDPLLSHD